MSSTIWIFGRRRAASAWIRGMGQYFVDDPQSRANVDKTADGLAAYQRDAMVFYADARPS